MKNTRDSEPVPCRDIDPAELFEQGLAPGAYHDIQEVTQEVISDSSCCKIAVIAEECSRCSASISGLQVLGDVPEVMQNLKELTNDVYEAFYENPRTVHHIAMGQHMAEVGQEALVELFKSLQLAAGLSGKNAEDGTGKRSKQEIWAQILGPEFADGDSRLVFTCDLYRIQETIRMRRKTQPETDSAGQRLFGDWVIPQ